MKKAVKQSIVPAEASRYPKRGNRLALAPTGNIMAEKDLKKKKSSRRRRKLSWPPPPPEYQPAKYGGVKVQDGLWMKNGFYYQYESDMESRSDVDTESDEEDDAASDSPRFRHPQYLPQTGFTYDEYQICFNYMKLQSFEYLDTIPEEKKEFKMHIDTVRGTKGFGVTKHYRCIGGNYLAPAADSYTKNPKVRGYIDKAIGVALAQMKQELGTIYQSLSVANLVYSGASDCYLLSLRVEESGGGPGRTRSGRKPALILEVIIYGNRRGPEPKNSDHLEVSQWKLRCGTKVLHCNKEVWD